LTVHDLLFNSMPEFIDSIICRIYFELIHNRSASQAAKIITVSDFTRKELMRFHPDAAHKSYTIHNGISEAFTNMTDETAIKEFREKTGVFTPYFLAVGSLKRHKNFATLLKSFALLKTQATNSVKLVIIAKRDLRNPDDSIAGLVQKLNLSADVTFTDDLTETLLAAAYSGAEAFISTSLYEGFGLPIVEAMASRTPLILSDIDVFHEITRGSALYIDPYSAASVTNAMIKVLNDTNSYRNIVATAYEHSFEYSWKITALKTMAIYREAAGS
ncbi:MAG: glycosyltransferase family 4 protein, partial [Gammaproteobacteria bacterium]|nr:glycosyltransferase family 4 protein [Gammaproteobacteria bacterium]